MTREIDSIQEMIALIKVDENNRAYFFSKAKDPKWFEPLKSNGFFDASTIPQPTKTEKGFALSFWPPQNYLERISALIQSKAITDTNVVESFLEVLRKVASTRGNFLLARSLFLIVMRIPLSQLKKNDIERAFAWLMEGGERDTLTETTVQEGLALMLSGITESPHERSLFREFVKHFLAISSTEKYRDRDPKLVFFSNWGHKQLRDKYFRVEKLAATAPFVLFDTIEVSEKLLADILSSTDVDKSTPWWRPAVEEHHQNNFHDSAQSIIVGIIGMSAKALISRGHSLRQLDNWRQSKFKTFNRLYLFIASQSSNRIVIEAAAQKILELDFAYECKHEIYHFLANHFETLSATTQDKILDFIEKITSDFADSEELKTKQTAWQKLRWLEAIANSGNARVRRLRAGALAITDNKVPEHPDFASYMGPTFVGYTSPRDERWFSESSFEDIINLLLTFKDTSEFASPSIEGLARVLESWVVSDPMKASALIKEFGKMSQQYVSAILDGYTKGWSEKKYVPVSDLLESIRKLIADTDFEHKVGDADTKINWIVGSICRFIDAGTRSDEHAFPPESNGDCYFILKKCLDSTPADKLYDSSSDAYTRAINEPRGRVIEALIVLTLRRARLAGNDSAAFTHAWNSLRDLIDPILQKQDKNEASLHAHIGAYYRQFLFLSKDWLTKNLDLAAPPSSESKVLWRAFMDGFGYVTAYSPDIYSLLKCKGHLLNYLRVDIDSDDRSSRHDRLQTRIIELALVAYVVGDETLEDGIIATILKDRNSEEWRQMIWSVPSIIGEEPKPEHLSKAKVLISKLIEIRDSKTLGEDFTEHIRGLGRFLSLLKDPTDPLVSKIVKAVAVDKESPWELGDLIEYLHQFKDSHSKEVGILFKALLSESKTAPAWPAEKVREISESLLKYDKDIMIDVCRVYSDRSPTCEPIRDICSGIGIFRA